jgi:hypothetical protein
MFYPGDSMKIRYNITSETTGELYDPATVRFHYKNPAGTIVTKTYGVDTDVVSKIATGIYQLVIYIPYTLTSVGRWYIDGQSLDGSSNSLDLTHLYRDVAPVETLTS